MPGRGPATLGTRPPTLLPLAAGREEAFDTVLYSTLTLVLGVVGTLIASRHPGNPIGWLFCGMALWGAVAELGEAYGYVAAERGLPGGVAGEWLISWSWIVDVAAWVVVVLLFPDGRLLGTALLAVAEETMQPTQPSLWLRPQLPFSSTTRT